MTTIAQTTYRTPESADLVERRLRGAWRKEVTFLGLRGLGWLLVTVGGLVVVDFALDWTFDLPPLARLLLLLGNLACLGATAWNWLLRPIGHFDDVQIALRVESACGRRDGLLVSSVQFQNDVAAGSGMSADLMRAVRRQAVSAAAGMDFGRIVSRSLLRPAVPLAAAVACILLAGSLWRPAHAAALALRMLSPWTAAQYPTDTRIEVLGGNLTVRLGEPVKLGARADGQIPEQGRLFVHMRGSAWESLPLSRQGAADFSHTFPRAADDFDYYFTLGDAHSKRYQVTVARPPRIAETRVQLDYPSYTHRKAETVSLLNIKVPEGTAIQWQLRLDRPVTAAELLIEGHKPLPMRLDNDGTLITLRHTPDASDSYSLNLHWRLEARSLLEPGPKHFLQVIPDADPRVGITSPVEDGKGTLSKVLALSFWAKDDYALGPATIVYSLNDSAEQRLTMGPGDGKTSVEATFAWKLAETIPGLREGDLITFAVEASDIRVGAAHTTRSYSRRIQTVSPAEYLAYTIARQHKFLGQLRPLYLQELEAATSLRTLNTPATAPVTRSPSTADKDHLP